MQTPVDRSLSPLAEKNLQSKIDVGYVDREGVSELKKTKKVYKCPKCDFTVGLFNFSTATHTGLSNTKLIIKGMDDTSAINVLLHTTFQTS